MQKKMWRSSSSRQGGNTKLGRSGFVISAVLLVFLAGIGGCGQEPDKGEILRADMLSIETLAQFGNLQEPPAIFLHEKHTKALEEQKKDCSTCHPKGEKKIPFTDGNVMSLKFERVKDIDRNQTLTVYHTRCIDCHKERRASALAAGPVTCGECHQDKPDALCSIQPLSFDNMLHYRHIKANDKKCELCHHAYDEKTKKLVYEKGKEQSCRDCHGEKAEQNRESMRTVAHEGCIECHQKKRMQKKDAGPANCFGCHELENQQAFKKVVAVPRLERNQPDVVLVRVAKADQGMARMNAVLFDHKAHESAMSTCRVCHHATMQACSECHTMEGEEKGKQFTLERSMHEVGSRTSCIGCHRREMAASNCAGCHTHINMSALATSTCKKCHNGPTPEEAPPGKIQPGDFEALLPPVSMTDLTFAEKEIPKEIEIKLLSQEYELVRFPHWKIIEKLKACTKDSNLAMYFHAQQDTLCLGCHHKSERGTKPALCSSCHSRPSITEGMYMPRLQAAYHLQCISCHKQMKVGPTGCVDCHKKKGEPEVKLSARNPQLENVRISSR